MLNFNFLTEWTPEQKLSVLISSIILLGFLIAIIVIFIKQSRS